MTTAKLQTLSVSAPQKSTGLMAFFGLTYVLALLTWGVLVIFQMSVINTANTTTATSPLAMTLLMLGGFTPSIAGLIMAWRQNGRAGLRNMWKRFTQFNIGIKWYLVMIIIPFLVQIGTALVYKLQGGTFVWPELLLQPASLIPFAIAILIGGPISEEFGWRGFAQDRVQARWGQFKGSIILGVMWALWHLPLFFVPGSGQQQTGNPAIMFPMFTLNVVAMAILITLVYNKTNRSLWGAIFFHFALNFGANILLASSEISDGFLYVVNAIWMTLIAVVIARLTRSRKNS